MTKARTLADNYAADINQVTASAPLTGGGTSGTVTVGIQDGTTSQKGAVQLEDSTASTSTTKASTPNSVKSAYDLANGAIAKSTVDAKGDLLVGTANDTISRLAVASTAGYVLTVDSAEATGLKWAAAAGGGKVLQVVMDDAQSSTTNTTGTYADTGLSVTITPSSTASKVLIIASFGFEFTYGTSATRANGLARLVVGSTPTELQIADPGVIDFASSSNKYMQQYLTIAQLHSPNTTSATTYKIQINCSYSTSVTLIGSGTRIANIIAMEIGA